MAKKRTAKHKPGTAVGRRPVRKKSPARGKRDETKPDDDDTSTLRKFLAASGLDSRRKIEEYLTMERVTVDGDVVTEPSTRVHPGKQRICVDGERLKLEPKRYFLLNKPKGCLCTNRDPRGRLRAVDLVTVPGLRLFTVGRLDENSEGLLLVTNDGDLANKLAHPRYQVRRKYKVQVAGIPKRETLRELREGLYFKEGRFRLHGAKKLKTQGKSTFLEIEMREGQNREIRRLMARVGHKVIQLQRIEFGPLKLGRIVSGKFRPLKPPEVKALRQFAEELERQPMGSDRRRQHSSGPGKKTTAKKSAAKRSTADETDGKTKAGKTATKKKPTGRKPDSTGKRGATSAGKPKRKGAKKRGRKR